VIDLDELFRVAGSIIFVNVPGLEFLWPDNLLEWWSQSMETAPP
jgi:ABC-type phosphate transport system auxiliary subunit